MSKEHFEIKKPLFESTPDNETKYPDFPVDTALQEAEALHVWVQNDKGKLTAAALDWTLVDDLPIRAGACRHAESMWNEEANIKKEAQVAWAEKQLEAKELREELLHHFEFAYAKDASLMATVKKIKEGDSLADMIQDLSDLSVLGKSHPGPLKTIGMDLGLLDKAGALAAEAASFMAHSQSARAEKNEWRIARDKAFWHMQEAVEEIYRTGNYIFWKDEARRKGYHSNYKRTKSKSRRKNGDNGQEQNIASSAESKQ